jgi:hypothetical protein
MERNVRTIAGRCRFAIKGFRQPETVDPKLVLFSVAGAGFADPATFLAKGGQKGIVEGRGSRDIIGAEDDVAKHLGSGSEFRNAFAMRRYRIQRRTSRTAADYSSRDLRRCARTRPSRSSPKRSIFAGPSPGI